jgi:hypothetical protein
VRKKIDEVLKKDKDKPDENPAKSKDDDGMRSTPQRMKEHEVSASRRIPRAMPRNTIDSLPIRSGG